MKIVVIAGSYHRGGVIASLIQHFKQGVASEDPSAEIRVIDLLDVPVGFCSGCNSCAKSDARPIGECSQKDAMDPILREMVDCDRLVMATPVYMYSPTALTKRFLERCFPLSDPKAFLRGRIPCRKNKKALVIASTGAPFPVNILLGFTRNTLRVLSLICRMSGCYTVETMACGGAENSEKARYRSCKKARAAGARFAREGS